MVEVTEADKQMVADYLAAISINMPNLAALILANESALARCFAAHRTQAAKAMIDGLDKRPMNPVLDMAYERWRILLTGEQVREIVKAALADALESQHD